ncbi:MAG: GNAT family N-acetyltransferase [Proteobacteria bacterium]|nr:GNAT family N-acetyltransferase [Pseudomonadota bacterium]
MKKYEIIDPENIIGIFAFKILDHKYPVGYAKLSNNNGKIILADIYIYDHTQANSNLSCLFKKLSGKKNYRGKGIGTYFLKHIVEFCKNNGAKYICGEAIGDIPKLKKWYESFGFPIDADNNIELPLLA